VRQVGYLQELYVMYHGGQEGAGDSLHKTEMSAAPAMSVEELWNYIVKEVPRHGLLELSISCPVWLNRSLVIGIFLCQWACRIRQEFVK